MLFTLAMRLVGLQSGRIRARGRNLGSGPRALAPLVLVVQWPTLALDLAASMICMNQINRFC
jgi:hypothetical protein